METEYQYLNYLEEEYYYNLAQQEAFEQEGRDDICFELGNLYDYENEQLEQSFMGFV